MKKIKLFVGYPSEATRVYTSLASKQKSVCGLERKRYHLTATRGKLTVSNFVRQLNSEFANERSCELKKP